MAGVISHYKNSHPDEGFWQKTRKKIIDAEVKTLGYLLISGEINSTKELVSAFSVDVTKCTVQSALQEGGSKAFIKKNLNCRKNVKLHKSFFVKYSSYSIYYKIDSIYILCYMDR